MLTDFYPLRITKSHTVHHGMSLTYAHNSQLIHRIVVIKGHLSNPLSSTLLNRHPLLRGICKHSGQQLGLQHGFIGQFPSVHILTQILILFYCLLEVIGKPIQFLSQSTRPVTNAIHRRNTLTSNFNFIYFKHQTKLKNYQFGLQVTEIT